MPATLSVRCEELESQTHCSEGLCLLRQSRNAFGETLPATRTELTMYTVIRIDSKLHKPHWVAQDQTIRVLENKFETFSMDMFCISDIFWLISKFPDYVPCLKDGNFRCFKVFLSYSLFKRWDSLTFWRFPIIFPFQRMKVTIVYSIKDNKRKGFRT